ncbi:MAG: type IV pili twitching motility protein PilT, partial [Gammaproteobacteria bacterium]
MLKILPYMKLCVEKNGSDLFFTANAPAQVKIEGELMPVGKNLLTRDFIKELAFSILTPEQKEHLQRH